MFVKPATREVPVEPVDRSQRQREVLSDQVAQRILARAAELDAAQRAAVDVANLRAAAVEAGISSSAFDSALDEMQGDAQPPAAPSRRRGRRTRALILGASALVVFGGMAVTRAVVPVRIPMAEQAFLLRCLPAGEAAELIRPMLGPTSTVAVSPARSPRTITIRSTPEHMAEVRAILDERDGAACAAPPTTR